MATPGTPNAISLRDIQTEFGGPNSGGQWVARSGLSTTVLWTLIGYGNNTFVAIAPQSGVPAVVSTSPDGISWTTRTIPNSDWGGLAFGNGIFLAVAGFNPITATSTDGITWTQRGTLPSSANWRVVFGNGVFLAYDSGTTSTKMATSTDGVTWTAVTFPVASVMRAVAFGAGLFVVLPWNTNTLYTSPNGVTWTARTLPTTGTWWVAQYGGDRFVCLSDVNQASVQGGSYLGGSLISSDGITWTYNITPSGLPIGASWVSLAYGDGLFFAQANVNSATVSNTCLSTAVSSDGITWTPKAIFTRGGTSTRDGIAFGNNTFVSVGQRSPVCTYNITTEASLPPYYRGSNWVSTSISANAWWVLAFGNNTFVAVTQSGTTSATSTDGGVTWTTRTLPISASFWSSLKFGGGLFMLVAGGQGANAYLTSPDGITWTTRSLPTIVSPASWNCIIFGNGQYVAFSSGTVGATSPDGINWTTRTIPNASSGIASIFANGVYLTVGTGGTGAISSDGITWTQVTLPISANFRELAFGNGMFVATSSGFSNFNWIVSNNGVEWLTLQTPDRLMTNVAFGGGVFAVTPFGSLTKAATSVDGLTWTQGRTVPLAGWSATAFGNGRFVSVAFNGSGARSMYLELGSNIYTTPGALGVPSGVPTLLPASGTTSLSDFRSAGVFYLDYIVVGGGGGGGPGFPDATAGGGGGGGGGGVAIGTNIPFVLEGFGGQASVGIGGVSATQPATQSSSGGNSRLTIYSAYDYTSLIIDGNGGAGGKGGTTPSGGSGGAPGGNSGGSNNGASGGSNGFNAGGGGAGIDNSAPTGSGGNGVTWSLNNVVYGGGGGGGGTLAGTSTGGTGGGGSGVSNGVGQNGTNGLGGGGGGGGSNTVGDGGSGGSGVIIISYVSSIQLINGGTVTTSGGRFFHTFSTVGSTSFTSI